MTDRDTDSPCGLEPLSIRSAEREDVPLILAIEQAAYSHPWAESLFLGCFRDNYANFVLTEQEQVQAYAFFMLGAGEGHLLNLCVAPTAQRRGYGRLLLHSVLDEAARRGVEHVFLEVRESNQVAQRLYLSMGFNEIGHRAGYYPAASGRESARVMAKFVG